MTARTVTELYQVRIRHYCKDGKIVEGFKYANPELLEQATIGARGVIEAMAAQVFEELEDRDADR